MSAEASLNSVSSSSVEDASSASVADAGFAVRLRDATKLVHREAERTGFIADLIRGRASRGGYALFLSNLVPVYDALERALDAHAKTPLIAAFSQPGLRRLPNLVGDLEAIDRAGEMVRGALLPEARIYADAIKAACDDGARLVAHAYARYLGDLSGGQILKPILARSLGLAPEMLGFYDFPGVADPEVAKAVMRQALDLVPAWDPAADRIVDEAVAAFRHNIDLSLAVSRMLHEPAGCKRAEQT